MLRYVGILSRCHRFAGVVFRYVFGQGSRLQCYGTGRESIAGAANRHGFKHEREQSGTAFLMRGLRIRDPAFYSGSLRNKRLSVENDIFCDFAGEVVARLKLGAVKILLELYPEDCTSWNFGLGLLSRLSFRSRRARALRSIRRFLTR